MESYTGYILAIVMAVTATVLILISTILYAVVSNRTNNSSRRNLLRAAAAFTALSIIMVIISVILSALLIGKSKFCIKSTGINIASVIVFILLVVMIGFSLTVSFVTAGQLKEEKDDNNSRILIAGSIILIIAVLLFVISYIILYVKSSELLKSVDKYGRIICEFQNKSGNRLDTKNIRKYISNPAEILSDVSKYSPELIAGAITEVMEESGDLNLQNIVPPDISPNYDNTVDVKRLIECAQNRDRNINLTIPRTPGSIAPGMNYAQGPITQDVVANAISYAQSPVGKKVISDFLKNYGK